MIAVPARFVSVGGGTTPQCHKCTAQLDYFTTKICPLEESDSRGASKRSLSKTKPNRTHKRRACIKRLSILNHTAHTVTYLRRNGLSPTRKKALVSTPASVMTQSRRSSWHAWPCGDQPRRRQRPQTTGGRQRPQTTRHTSLHLAFGLTC